MPTVTRCPGHTHRLTSRSSASTTTLYDPTEPRLACDPTDSMVGTKNLEIYTSRSTQGLYAFAPWNNKSMIRTDSRPIQRAFVVVVQNTIPAPRFGQSACAADPVPPERSLTLRQARRRRGSSSSPGSSPKMCSSLPGPQSPARSTSPTRRIRVRPSKSSSKN